jgi:hypothetical protein
MFARNGGPISSRRRLETACAAYIEAERGGEDAAAAVHQRHRLVSIENGQVKVMKVEGVVLPDFLR